MVEVAVLYEEGLGERVEWVGFRFGSDEEARQFLDTATRIGFWRRMAKSKAGKTLGFIPVMRIHRIEAGRDVVQGLAECFVDAQV